MNHKSHIFVSLLTLVALTGCELSAKDEKTLKVAIFAIPFIAICMFVSHIMGWDDNDSFFDTSSDNKRESGDKDGFWDSGDGDGGD